MYKSISFEGSVVRYREMGKGDPLVLLHGFAEDHEVWEYQWGKLEHKARLILPDIPGSGGSEMLKAGSSGQPSIEDYAEVIRAIVREEKIEKFTLIGHSMGGYIALAYAEKWEATLTGLGLFHSTAYPDTEDKVAGRKRGIEFMESHGAHEFLKQAIPNLFGSHFRLENPALIDKLIARGANFSVSALVQYYEAMMFRPNRTGTLKSLGIPVLFIIGEEDKTVNLQDSLSQTYLPAVSHVNILPGVAHMGMWESIDRSNQSIMKFLDLLKEQ